MPFNSTESSDNTTQLENLDATQLQKKKTQSNSYIFGITENEAHVYRPKNYFLCRPSNMCVYVCFSFV